MEKIKLGKVVDIISGFAFDSRMFNDHGGTPLIRIRDVKRGYTETYTTQDYDKKYIIKNGDILIGMDGEFNIGKWKSKEALLNQRVCKIIPKEINADYLFYLLPKKLKGIESRTAFVTVKHLSVKQIENIEIDLIEMEQQKKVAKKLEMISKILEIKQVQIEQLNELIKSQFIEMFENKNFELKTLNEISIIKGEYGSGASAGEFVEGQPRYVRITDIQENGRLNNQSIASPKNEDNIDKYILQYGDVLFARTGATVGKTYKYNEDDGYCIYAGYCIRFRLDLDICNPDYIFIYTKTDSYKKWVENKQRVVAQPNINAKEYGNDLKIPIPPIELQNQFAEFVKQIDKQKFEIQKSLEEMKSLQESLMNKYFG